MGEIAPDNAAQVIDDDEMVFDAGIGIALHAVEDFDDRSDLDGQPRFLEHFARDRLFERFAELHGAARQAPFAFERLVRALDEHHAAGVENDGADADDRSRGMNSVVSH